MVFTEWIKPQFNNLQEIDENDFFEFKFVDQDFIDHLGPKADFHENVKIKDHSLNVFLFPIEPNKMTLELNDEKNLIQVIPNVIDTNVWRPIDMLLSRKILGLSCDKKLVLFGAIGVGADHRKGFDLLMMSIEILDSSDLNYELVVFGGLEPEKPLPTKCKVHYVGALNDDISLSLLYSAVDVFVIPSRIDNLPNTGVEAQACGTPVVAFNVGGLGDIVQHKVTGYLAIKDDVVDLAQGIAWVINRPNNKLRVESRVGAVKKWSPSIVAKQYYDLYSKVMGG
jgi:glycosyltransferase involved in cell wall biosynthesis